MNIFWLCFVPLFVALDPIGMVPLFIAAVSGMEKHHVRAIIYQSLITATLVALFFLMLGTATLRLLGITVADFMVAGGFVLFIIALNDLLVTSKKRREPDPQAFGAVPLGVPLIAGPGLLTTSMLLEQQYGFVMTGSAILANMLLMGLGFFFARPIHRLLGQAGSKIVSKLVSLLLAAIAVMLIRKGVMQIIAMG